MTYIIRITDTKTAQAQSLLFFLKSLAETQEYNFLKIEQENEGELSEEIKQELDFRYQHFLMYGDTYNDWDDVKHKYVKQ